MGKFLVILLLLSTVVAGAGLYYLQIYGYYYEVEAQPGHDVALLPKARADDVRTPEFIAYDSFQAIDADSSPIRYRACFTTDLSLETLSATYTTTDEAVPLTAPDWFDCYDAATIAEALDQGRARAFIAAKNIHFGVDRLVAVTDTGQGYIWHALNNCGEKAYDGTVVGEECPPRPGN